MWSLWQLQKATGIPASSHLRIAEWAQEQTGLQPDIWTALQFNLALNYFGIFVQNKLDELDDNMKPVNRLEDILGEKSQSNWTDAIRQLKKFGL
jgi:hypothetical protein